MASLAGALCSGAGGVLVDASPGVDCVPVDGSGAAWGASAGGLSDLGALLEMCLAR
jgi:hypothetical protein